jgi:hypothetical protein
MAAIPVDVAQTDPARRELASFHGLPEVRAALVAFLGGRTLRQAQAEFITVPTLSVNATVERPRALWKLLEREGEAARSLWERGALIADLDLEHVHFERPWEPLLLPERSFALQQPVVAAVDSLLAGWGIEALHFLTGRGHHFVWRVPGDSPAFAALASLGTLWGDLAAAYASPQPPAGAVVGAETGRAWDGLGRVMEYVAHGILRRAAPQTALPIQLTAVIVGPGPGGREILSLDLSEYADPLHARAVRMPFSGYRKHLRLGWTPPRPVPAIVALPASGNEPADLAAMRDLAAAAARARRAATAIPDAAAGTARLIEEYRRSELARWHEAFYAVAPDGRDDWPRTYDRLDLARLPRCVGRLLEHPNDWLLQPAAIQLLVRYFVAEGWPARHVAGLLRSKYERPHGWLPRLHFHDAGVRADVYARIFGGLIATGRDGAVDLNCTSTQEKDLCPREACPYNLEHWRDKLLAGGAHG